jgi:polysaccharide deacetylase family protein (PEP-CTERM system associated)
MHINALTFDLEDWYQSTVDINAQIRDVILRQTVKVLEILADAKAYATFFALGLVAEKFPDLITRIAKEGHEIATHGYKHQLIFTQTPSEFASDLKHSIALLEDITGRRVIGHRAPDFSITEKSLWALDILQEQGILYDSSIFPIKHRRYGINRCQRGIHYITKGGQEGKRARWQGEEARWQDGKMRRQDGKMARWQNGNSLLAPLPPCHSPFAPLPSSALIEFPLSTISLLGINFPVCGGGYLRLMPYIATREAIKKLASEGMPAMIYMHPYEFDAQDLSTLIDNSETLRLKFLRFNQNLNRDKSEMKLRKLLNDFKFAPIKDVLRCLRVN